MIVENHSVDEDATKDCFPVGMRVLAVDDDQICLNVLEKMLRKCQYHVTTTTQSIKALEMLRENRNKFDLVISDINMPHMDGFKLLEIVGLEMDLPVIMLTGYIDKERVMKGVMHGACDYLIKPPRIEVLQNIWQHVMRRKIDFKDKDKSSNEEKTPNMVGEGGQGITSEKYIDYNKKLCQKRKEPSDEKEEDDEENVKENKESSTQKKSRIFWNVELHTKFVAAVNQLGIDKAVPKRILDLMNVEGLTRENVSKHLQKYRRGLKKATQQDNVVAALGYSGPYLQTRLMDRYSGPRRILTTAQPSYASGGIFCRLNSPIGLNMRGIGSSALVRPVQLHNINSSKESLGNIQLPMFSANQSLSLSQDIPKSFELIQFQQSNNTTSIGQFNPIGGSSGFTVSSGFPDNRANVNNANNSLPNDDFSPLSEIFNSGQRNGI